MSSPILFYADFSEDSQICHWIREFRKEVSENVILVSDRPICKKMFDFVCINSKIGTMVTDSTGFWFSDFCNENQIKGSLSGNKILYINNLPYKYSQYQSMKKQFGMHINHLDNNADIEIVFNSMRTAKELDKQNNIIDDYDFDSWKIFFGIAEGLK